MLRVAAALLCQNAFSIDEACQGPGQCEASTANALLQASVGTAKQTSDLKEDNDVHKIPTIILPNVPVAQPMGNWGWDVKQMWRIGQMGRKPAKADYLYGPDAGKLQFNVLRIPIFGSKGTEGSGDAMEAHPAPGSLNFAFSPSDGRDYSGVLKDIKAVKASQPDVKIFASLKLNVGGVPLPKWCFKPLPEEEQHPDCHADQDGEELLYIDEVISKKCAVVDPVMYAKLLFDFLKAFKDQGVDFDVLGLENETGWITVQVYLKTLDALEEEFKNRDDVTMPPKPSRPKLVLPENYHPNWEWLEEYRKTNDTRGSIAGTHFYGMYHMKAKVRNMFLRFIASANKMGLPKWHTEVHSYEQKEEALFLNDIAHAENANNQFADYLDAGFDGIVHWAYPLGPPKRMGHLLRVESLRMACVGCAGVLTTDQDGQQPLKGNLNSRTSCKPDGEVLSCTLWVTNAGEDSLDIADKSFHLGAGKFSGDVKYRQWTVQDDCNSDGVVEDSNKVHKSAIVVDTAEDGRSFVLDLPRESWTLVEFSATGLPSTPSEHTTTSNVTVDAFINEANKDQSFDNWNKLFVSGKKNRQRKTLVTFQVQVPPKHQVRRATLKLYIDPSSETIPDLMAFPVSKAAPETSTWNEVTPNIAEMAVGAAVDLQPDTWVDVPVTNAVRRGCNVFALATEMGKKDSAFILGGLKSERGAKLEVVTVEADIPDDLVEDAGMQC